MTTITIAESHEYVNDLKEASLIVMMGPRRLAIPESLPLAAD